MGRDKNWFAVIPLCAWVRHLARVTRTRSLFNTIGALFNVYQEAFVLAEVTSQQLVGAMTSKSLSDARAKREEGRFGPMRFMYEFVGMLEQVRRNFYLSCFI